MLVLQVPQVLEGRCVGSGEPLELVEPWNAHPSSLRTGRTCRARSVRISKARGRFSRPFPPVAGKGYYAVTQIIEGNHGQRIETGMYGVGGIRMAGARGLRIAVSADRSAGRRGGIQPVGGTSRILGSGGFRGPTANDRPDGSVRGRGFLRESFPRMLQKVRLKERTRMTSCRRVRPRSRSAQPLRELAPAWVTSH